MTSDRDAANRNQLVSNAGFLCEGSTFVGSGHRPHLSLAKNHSSVYGGKPLRSNTEVMNFNF